LEVVAAIMDSILFVYPSISYSWTQLYMILWRLSPDLHPWLRLIWCSGGLKAQVLYPYVALIVKGMMNWPRVGHVVIIS
jgi:hypothetical protein